MGFKAESGKVDLILRYPFWGENLPRFSPSGFTRGHRTRDRLWEHPFDRIFALRPLKTILLFFVSKIKFSA